MPIPPSLEGGLALPAVAAPMFLTSGPDLVVETCKNGVIGTFPALNQRTSEGFEAWLVEIERALSDFEAANPGKRAAPYGVNLIVHHTNPRLQADLEICVKHKVPLIITSLGAVADLVDAVHGYGGVVFHDVTTVRHGRKAAGAGVDGLILVCAGAGGHAGIASPFALVPEIRQFFDGTILLAGCISDGRGIAAAEMMGADMAYLGTRFINTKESMVKDANRQMIIDAAAAHIVYTPALSGIPANFLRESLVKAGLDPDNLPAKKEINMGEELDTESRAWKDIWSAGQGVGSIDDVPSAADLCQKLTREYRDAIAGLAGKLATAAE